MTHVDTWYCKGKKCTSVTFDGTFPINELWNTCKFKHAFVVLQTDDVKLSNPHFPSSWGLASTVQHMRECYYLMLLSVTHTLSRRLAVEKLLWWTCQVRLLLLRWYWRYRLQPHGVGVCEFMTTGTSPWGRELCLDLKSILFLLYNRNWGRESSCVSTSWC